jgi:hypothetical protein
MINTPSNYLALSSEDSLSELRRDNSEPHMIEERIYPFSHSDSFNVKERYDWKGNIVFEPVIELDITSKHHYCTWLPPINEVS